MIKQINAGRFFIGLILLCILVVCAGCSSSSSSDVADGGTDVGNPDYEVTVSGSVQKGPFQQYTVVEVYELDDNLNQTGIDFYSETLDDLGNFTLPVNLSSPYISLIAKEGNYYDEIADTTRESLTLSALADLSEYVDGEGDPSQINVNLNILTTLAMSRVVYLTDEGETINDAFDIARREILDAFEIYSPEDTNFEHMDILQDGDSNAKLLAVSLILMQMANDSDIDSVTAALEEYIGDIRSDIQYDGILENDEIIDAIKQARMDINCPLVRERLETRYGVTIPPFEDYIQGEVTVRWSIDCETNFIHKINAEIFNSNNEVVFSNDTEWYCDDGEGTVAGVNAGMYPKIIVTFLDAEDNIVDTDTITDVFVETGETTIVDTVVDAVMAEIIAPSDNASFNTGEEISFEASVYMFNDIEPYFEWDFGDGTTSEGQSVNHVYSSSGTGSVVFTVYNEGEVKASPSVIIHVFGDVSDFTGSYKLTDGGNNSISITIDDSGNITGKVTMYQAGLTFNLTGIISPDGTFEFSYSYNFPFGYSGTVTYTGSVDWAGNVTGIYGLSGYRLE